MLDTVHLLKPSSSPPISRSDLRTLQVNLGFRCNLSCTHCHVNAGPGRTEEMPRETIGDVLQFLENHRLSCLDLTGGAPELHPDFHYLVEKTRGMGLHVIDRCNLTVMQETGQENLAEFLAEHQVEIVASLPCYLEENVDSQRGKGAYERSIFAYANSMHWAMASLTPA